MKKLNLSKSKQINSHNNKKFFQSAIIFYFELIACMKTPLRGLSSKLLTTIS